VAKGKRVRRKLRACKQGKRKGSPAINTSGEDYRKEAKGKNLGKRGRENANLGKGGEKEQLATLT